MAKQTKPSIDTEKTKEEPKEVHPLQSKVDYFLDLGYNVNQVASLLHIPSQVVKSLA